MPMHKPEASLLTTIYIPVDHYERVPEIDNTSLNPFRAILVVGGVEQHSSRSSSE